MKNHLFLAFSMLLIYSCSEGIEVSQSSTVDAAVKSTSLDRDPFESNYKPLASERTLIKSVNLYDGLGNEFSNFDVLFDNGIIEEIGKDIVDGDATIIDAKGKWLTPGIIDIHSHMGVYPAPGVRTSSDGNEATSPITAEVWAEHSVWTQDPQFSLALKGGVTAFHVLPGSANLMGGRGATFKNIPRNTIHDMKFPGAPHSLKMACGENPKRVYGNRGSAPSTRMGNMAGYRKAWINASDYQRRKNEYTSKSDEAKELIDPPKRNLELDTLARVSSSRFLLGGSISSLASSDLEVYSFFRL